MAVFGNFVQGLQAGQQAQMQRAQMEELGAERRQRAAGLLAKGVLNSQNPAMAYERMRNTVAPQMFPETDLSFLPETWGPDAERVVTMFAEPQNFWDNHRVVGRHVVGPAPGGGVQSVFESPVTPTPQRAPAGYQYGPGGDLVPIPGGPADTAATTQRDIDALAVRMREAGIEEGSPEWNTRIANNGRLPRAGQRIEVGQDGHLVITQGGAAGSGMGTPVPGPTGNRIAGMELDTRDVLSGLQQISQRLIDNPEALDILTLGGQLEAAVTDWQDYLKIPGVEPTPEAAERFQAMVQFRADAYDQLNRYIKAITGAAMTIQEAERITKAFPSPEDGPLAFMAKMKGAIQRSQVAVARYHYWRKNGFAPDAVTMQERGWQNYGDAIASQMTLGEMQRVMEDRRVELQQKIEAGEMSAEEASKMFFQEFGV